VSQRSLRLHERLEDDLAELVAYFRAEAPTEIDRLLATLVDRLRFIARYPNAGAGI